MGEERSWKNFGKFCVLSCARKRDVVSCVVFLRDVRPKKGLCPERAPDKLRVWRKGNENRGRKEKDRRGSDICGSRHLTEIRSRSMT